MADLVGMDVGKENREGKGQLPTGRVDDLSSEESGSELLVKTKPKRGRPTNAERTAKLEKLASGRKASIEGFIIREKGTKSGKENEVDAKEGNKRDYQKDVLIEQISDEEDREVNRHFIKSLEALQREVRELKRERELDRKARIEVERQWEKERIEWQNEIRGLRERLNKVEERGSEDRTDEVERKLRVVEQKIEEKMANGAEGLEEQDRNNLKRIIERQDKLDRKNNIVINGLIGEDKNMSQEVEELMRSKLEVELETKWIRIVGRQGNKIVIVGLRSWEDKLAIMRNKHKLRNSNVFINDDLSKGDRERQGRIREAAREQIRQGRDVKVGYNRIRIDGVWKKWEEGGREFINSDF